MKKLILLTDESVYGGLIFSGVAEIVDTLANSLTEEYDVSIICPDGTGHIPYTLSAELYRYNENVVYSEFSKVKYYMVSQKNWDDSVFALLSELEMDIFHNFSTKANFIEAIKPGVKTILTFDNYYIMPGTQEILNKYDFITTVADNYAIETLDSNSKLGNYLRHCGDRFVPVISGISETAFNPKDGILTLTDYSSEYQEGKGICKRHLLQTYGMENTPCVYSMMCRLVKAKNIEAVLEVLPIIKANNGVVLLVGKGETYYENLISKYKLQDDGLLFINRVASPLSAPALFSGSDFYLAPSVYEPCGLMPMSASVFGAIPIVSQKGGFKDNFNDENAIIIKDSMEDAIYQSLELYKDKQALYNKRKICMEQEQFFWKNRKMKYIDLYEA